MTFRSKITPLLLKVFWLNPVHGWWRSIIK